MPTVFVFGNPDIEFDSLPIQIIPDLKKVFPDIEFQIKDPNEEWEVPESLVIIDTAFGIESVTVFNDLKNFKSAPNVSMHDFDALANLRYLQKLGKLKKVTIIGVPPNFEKNAAISEVSDILKKFIK